MNSDVFEFMPWRRLRLDENGPWVGDHVARPRITLFFLSPVRRTGRKRKNDSGGTTVEAEKHGVGLASALPTIGKYLSPRFG